MLPSRTSRGLACVERGDRVTSGGYPAPALTPALDESCERIPYLRPTVMRRLVRHVAGSRSPTQMRQARACIPAPGNAVTGTWAIVIVVELVVQ